MMSTTSKVLLAIGSPAHVRVRRNAALALMARSSPTRSRSHGELRDRYRATGGNFVIVNTRGTDSVGHDRRLNSPPTSVHQYSSQ